MLFEGYPTPLMKKTMEVAWWLNAQGIRERTGKNDHPMIERFLERVGRGPRVAWCAAYVCFCVEAASDAMGRDNPPIKMSGLVWDLWQDALASNAFIPKSEVSPYDDIPEGTIFIIQRGDRTGHTGFVTKKTRSSGYYPTLEGNYKNRIGENTRSLNHGQLMGFIVYP